jgi:hypothetical protein
MFRNKQIVSDLRSFLYQAEQSQSKGELISHLKQLAAKQPRIAYDNRAHWGIVLTAWAATVIYVQNQHAPWLAYIPVVLFSWIYLIALLTNRISLTDASKHILHRCAQLDNGLEPVDCASTEAQRIKSAFKEFRRGNHSNGFIALLKGALNDPDLSLPSPVPFYAYEFEWVDEVEKTGKNHHGVKKTQPEYERHRRYGMIIETPVKNLLAGKYPRQEGDYKSASNEFNRLYAIKADPIAAARLFQPAVVESFNAFSTFSIDINYEFNSDGLLCLSFARNDLFEINVSGSLKDAAALAQSVSQPIAYPALNIVRQHLQTVFKYLD